MTHDDSRSPAHEAVDSDQDYSWLAPEEGYRLNAHATHYKQKLYLVLCADTHDADLVVETEFGKEDLTMALAEGRAIRICLATGPAVVSAIRLRTLLEPEQAGELIASVVAGFDVVPEEDYNGNWRHFGNLSDSANEALEQLKDRIEDADKELSDPDVSIIDPEVYVEDLDKEEIELLRQADTYAKIKELAAQMNSRTDVFIPGPFASVLAHVRETLIKDA